MLGRVKIVLQQPKYVQNLGSVVRACSCWSAEELIWTGQRIKLDMDRLPRELRMEAYSDVLVTRSERPFDLYPDFTPVCIELLSGSMPLPQFQHPTNAMYIFGPEDGSVSQVFRRLCHRFVYVPTKHCLNLAATVNVVLYDRLIKE